MFGIMNAPNPRFCGRKVWPAAISPSGSISWLTWVIPRNASMIGLLTVGGGGSGGGGAGSVSGTAAGGGAGGGSGAIASLVIPVRFLPRTLYLSPGVGGAGVPAATIGEGGRQSVISAEPDTNAADVILISGAAVAGGGGQGSSTAAGTAGSASTIATNTLSAFSGLGIWKAVAGAPGGTGGSTSGGAGGGFTWGASSICLTGGTGGGGCNTTTTTGTGGAMTGAGLVKTIAASAATKNGNPGFGVNTQLDIAGFAGEYPWAFFGFSGGTGGGGANTGTAGFGGQGAWGCGGGGGGGCGGTNGGTGGAAGAGGPGFIYASWW